MPRRGEKFQNLKNGKVYTVMIAENGMVVLETEDGENQILTGENNLRVDYVRITDKTEDGPNTPTT